MPAQVHHQHLQEQMEQTQPATLASKTLHDRNHNGSSQLGSLVPGLAGLHDVGLSMKDVHTMLAKD